MNNYKLTYKPTKPGVKPVIYHETAATEEEAVMRAELDFVVKYKIAHYEILPEVEVV